MVPSRALLVFVWSACALVFASRTEAQCPLAMPKAKSFSVSLVQAFVSCGNPGGTTPNATVENGTWPTCAPPETFNEAYGSPINGWVWGPKSHGTLKLKAAKNKVAHPLNTDPNAVDVTIQLNLGGILDGNGPAGDPVPTSGGLSLWLRRTFDDRAGGPMTMIDFPYSIGFAMSSGKAKLKTSLTNLLNNLGEQALPGCSSLEIIYVGVRDSNGANFGSMGITLPSP
jgi:hypothetical protein